jgi:uncharacterized repeat protein (TIGR03803 family)
VFIRVLGPCVLHRLRGLYGTTEFGGMYNYGTVFELSPNEGGGWTETVLHSFNNDGTDGWYPDAGLILDGAGNLYGTTIYGAGYGAVFEMSPNQGGGWTETVLYTFNGNGDGRYPHGSLVFDDAGNLYGTTDNGGIYCGLFQGCGTVFELTPTQGGGWTESVLHSFDNNGTDGINPVAGLIFDAAGNLYGTTFAGGTYGNGTVFEMSPGQGGGWTETVLHSFGPVPDGQQSWAGLIFDAPGNLYGTTRTGGTYSLGTVFELTPNQSGGWTETVLHSFGSGQDGFQPLYGSLIFDATGDLYGTTQEGGVYDYGTVFEVAPNGSGGWTETLLYNFCSQNGCADGYFPFAGLTSDAPGNLYGTTYLGGPYDDGTVFELTPIHPCIRCNHAGGR